MNIPTEFPFRSDAVVLDIGADTGDWASEMFARYHCRIHLYEPDKVKYEALRTRFENQPRVAVNLHGIGKGDGLFPVSTSGETQQYFLKDIAWVIEDLKVPDVDLVAIRPKAMTKDLIERLFSTCVIKRVRHLLLWAPMPEGLRDEVSETHYCSFSSEEGWQLWHLKVPSVMIRDSNFFNIENPERTSEYFDWKWDRTGAASDLTVYTDCHLQEGTLSKSKHKVAWLVEPPEIKGHIYRNMPSMEDSFDMIFTYSKKLLDRGNKYRFYAHGASWIHPPTRAVYPKTKMVSAIFSNKSFTFGHKFRQKIAKRFGGQMDLMGRGFKPLKNKVEGMRDYRFHVVVENCAESHYFSEKLVDCFYTGCVPIYYGLSNVGDFFNAEGIITFNKIEELADILKSLTPEEYDRRLSAVKENFLRADEYCSMEKWIWRQGLREFFV